METSRRLLDQMRRHDTLTNRTDTKEGYLAHVIERILSRRAIENKLDGYTLEASQEIAIAVLSSMEERN